MPEIQHQPANAIEIRNLTKTYSKKRGESLTAVDDLNLSVPVGQVFGFLGANGAGKTTTIKMMCGLIDPTAGSISLNGYDVRKQHGQAMKQIGAVLEGTRNVYWRLSALENLTYFGRLKGIYGSELKNRARLLLEELELWDRREDKIRTFSRGMQQKVAIACALIADPAIVLLDEPTLGLDVNAARTVRQWIATLARERKKTIVLTTHQLDMVQALCDQVAIMNKGKLVTNRPTQELLGLFRKEFYALKVQGRLNGHIKSLPAGVSVEEQEQHSVISSAIGSQSDLFDLIEQIRDMGLTLLSVNQVEPDLEEVFINYTNGAGEHSS